MVINFSTEKRQLKQNASVRNMCGSWTRESILICLIPFSSNMRWVGGRPSVQSVIRRCSGSMKI